MSRFFTEWCSIYNTFSMNKAGSAVKRKYISLPMHTGKPHEKVLHSQTRQGCHDKLFSPPDSGREAFGEIFLLPKYAGCSSFSFCTGLLKTTLTPNRGSIFVKVVIKTIQHLVFNLNPPYIDIWANSLILVGGGIFAPF